MKESNCILIAELGATNARIALTMEGTTLIESKEYLLTDFSNRILLLTYNVMILRRNFHEYYLF